MITKWFLKTIMIVTLDTGGIDTVEYTFRTPFDSRKACSVMANKLSEYPGFVNFTCIEKVIDETLL